MNLKVPSVSNLTPVMQLILFVKYKMGLIDPEVCAETGKPMTTEMKFTRLLFQKELLKVFKEELNIIDQSWELYRMVTSFRQLQPDRDFEEEFLGNFRRFKTNRPIGPTDTEGTDGQSLRERVDKLERFFGSSGKFFERHYDIDDDGYRAPPVGCLPWSVRFDIQFMRSIVYDVMYGDMWCNHRTDYKLYICSVPVTTNMTTKSMTTFKISDEVRRIVKYLRMLIIRMLTGLLSYSQDELRTKVQNIMEKRPRSINSEMPFTLKIACFENLESCGFGWRTKNLLINTPDY